MLPCSSSAHMEEERDAHMQTEVKQYKKRKEKETAQMFIFFLPLIQFIVHENHVGGKMRPCALSSAADGLIPAGVVEPAGSSWRLL